MHKISKYKNAENSLLLIQKNKYKNEHRFLSIQKEASHVLEVKAKPEYHRFLIGRGGANIRKVRDSTGARIIFPNSTDADQESITLIGKKESVEKAKAELESLIKDLVCVKFVCL